jgi:hypothetical protein
MNTISIDNTIATVKMELRSYDDAGQLDEVSMFKYADWVLNRLGRSLHKTYNLILNVENGQAEVPFNLKKISFAYNCNPCTGGTKTERWFYGNPYTYTVRDNVTKICYNKCCIEEEEEVITRTIYIDQEVCQDNYCGKQLLSLSKGVPTDKIGKDCPNLFCSSPNYFNLDEEKFYFNFQTGCVYLRYEGFQVDDENYPLLPNDPYILKAVEDYIIYKSFLNLYYNSEADVERKMAKAESEHLKSLGEALNYVRTPTPTQMKNWGRNKSRSLDIFNVPSKADYNRIK